MSRLLKTALTALLLIAAQARADYQCAANPQVDVEITPESVVVNGAQGKLEISPQGVVQFNSRPQQLSAAQREQAQRYQAALRQDLPWINQGARQRLKTARNALDRVVTEQLGEKSKVHQRVATLEQQLQQQMDTIVRQTGSQISFHHAAIDQVRSQGQQILQNTLGGVLQDSLNELGNMSSTQSNNPLQALVGNLGGLQQSIHQEWDQQQQNFQNFGKQVCQRVTQLEQQRNALMSALK